ncbi:riboflavin synthase [Synechococcus sp. M16CYN]|uniref:riboflavin synthase n=1 Tax=Synechococcus sp. M16CYN TaxID=3103139 RepID=UPI003249C106
MFTGLVQSVGTIQRRSGSVVVTGCTPFAPLLLGDSIAVDGVCLTVAELVGDGFRADVSEETLHRTTLGRKSELGGIVNLEPALCFSDRLGGHLVSGHVDAPGKVIGLETLPQSWRLKIRWQEPRFGRYVCEKASIAVDGISLTVADCSDEGVTFSVAVISHTWNSTSLQKLIVGDQVNLEVDQLARYAELLLKGKASNDNPLTKETDLSAAWLAFHGWS